MIYSIPYVLIILIFGGLAIHHQSSDDQNTKKRIEHACIGIMIFFFGFRGFVCDDWISYYPAFQKCDIEDVFINPFDSRREIFEPGFTFLMYLCKIIYDDYFFMSFVCTCINTILLVLFLRNRTECIPFAFVLYLCFGGYLMNTNLMRNSISILLFVNALQYLEGRKPVPYFLLCMLALLFHISAIVYFPLYFFFHIRCNKWIYATLFIIGNIIFLFKIPVFLSLISIVIGGAGERLQMLIEAYTEGEYGEVASVLSIGYLERVFTGVLIFCYYDKLVAIREENKLFINAFIGYIIIILYFGEFQILSQRLANLFIFAYWIIWYDFLKCFSIENNKKLFMVFLTLYCIMKIIGMTNMKASEYDNVLFGAKSYEERLYIHQQNDTK